MSKDYSQELSLLYSKKPTPQKVIFNFIPDDLKEIKKWCVWSYKVNDSKTDWSKPPINPKTNRYCKPNDPTTWVNYETAKKAYESGKYDGIGVLLKDKDCTGFDFDHCRDIKTGEIDHDIQTILNNLDTYTEISPSGDGLRAFTSTYFEPGSLIVNCKNNKKIEVYGTNSNRYLTVTGAILNDKKNINNVNQDVALALIKNLKKPDKQQELFESDNDTEIIKEPPANLPDNKSTEIDIEWLAYLDRRPDIRSLYDGDISKYNNDHSNADLALCNHLAFFFNKKYDLIERHFLLSGLGKRDKAKRPDYLLKTIGKAIQSCRKTRDEETYTGRREGKNPVKEFFRIDSTNIKKPFITLNDICALDIEEKPIINDFFYQNDPLLIHAAGGTGKSMFALQMALSMGIAKGLDNKHKITTPYTHFLNFKTAKQQTTLFLQSENSTIVFNQRAKKMCFEIPEYKSGLDKVIFHSQNCITTGFDFKSENNRGQIVRYITMLRDKYNIDITCIVIDPLISFVDCPENDSMPMRRALDGVNDICEKTQTTPIIVHHDKKNGDNYRGSSAIFDFARSIIHLQKEENSSLIKVKHTKSNNTALFKEFFMRLTDNLIFRTDKQERELSKREEKNLSIKKAVYQCLKNIGGIAEKRKDLLKEIMEFTGKSQKTSQDYISLAEEAGIIKRTGVDKKSFELVKFDSGTIQ